MSRSLGTTTIAEVTEALPWGLHDAYLEGMDVDWLASTLSLRVRVMISERQDMDRRATIRVTGLVFCSVDPPEESLHPRLREARRSGLDGGGRSAGA